MEIWDTGTGSLRSIGLGLWWTEVIRGWLRIALENPVRAHAIQ